MPYCMQWPSFRSVQEYVTAGHCKMTSHYCYASICRPTCQVDEHGTGMRMSTLNVSGGTAR